MRCSLRIYFIFILFLTGNMLYAQSIIPGAERFNKYLPMLKGKTVGIVANPTSKIGESYTIDTLLAQGVHIVKIFSPEHGLRGEGDAGEQIKNGKDKKTGLPVISLYGKNKQPTKAQLKGLDWVIYDIQDVGVRFYTYISTLHLTMEACAENNVKFMVLDRPNPLGYFVDGPVLDKKIFSSFVGMDPVPVVYGMTPGEYAKMLNGEGWLKKQVKCKLKVIECLNYNHNSYYQLPVQPSPNLPNMASIYLYPSLCLFEGTVISVGRGTDTPFQLFGHPGFKQVQGMNFSFVPQPNAGSSKPKLMGNKCYGVNLEAFGSQLMKGHNQLYLYWLVNSYKAISPQLKGDFFTNYFDLLAGTDQLRKQIIAGKTVDEIRASWQKDLNHFKEIRKKYLLYPDFR